MTNPVPAFNSRPLLLAALGLVVVIALLFLFGLLGGSPTASGGGTDRNNGTTSGTRLSEAADGPTNTPRPGRKAAASPLPRTESEATKRLRGELAEVTLPMREDVSSSLVETDLQEGETLVAGGYKTANGRHLFTFLSPKQLPDGSVKISSQVIEMSPDAAAQRGLDSLATNARNTLQHAETWDDAEVEKTLSQENADAPIDRVSMPTVIVRPDGTEFSVMIGQTAADGQNIGYELKGSVKPGPDGKGFRIRSHIIQREAEAGSKGNP